MMTRDGWRMCHRIPASSRTAAAGGQKVDRKAAWEISADIHPSKNVQMFGILICHYLLYQAKKSEIQRFRHSDLELTLFLGPRTLYFGYRKVCLAKVFFFT